MLTDRSFKAFSPRPRMILKLASRLALNIVALGSLATAEGPATWRYDLRPGDRLVYNYTFHLKSTPTKHRLRSKLDFTPRSWSLASAEVYSAPGSSATGTAPTSLNIA